MNCSIEKTITNLKNNNMEAYFCETKEEALEKVKSMIKKGDVISNGGSVTLAETGVMELIKSGDYNYLDRAREGITREEVEEVYRKAFSADVYFASANAITESGYIYNVDGNSNRVAAILYGPKSVILVVGKNKIVKTIDDAVTRVREIAAPKNTVRLGINSYCAANGKCMALNLPTENNEMCDGCMSDARICCNYVLSGKQRHKNRIKVIIVNEDLGY
ncbi:MAG: lactate utilization protein [Acutalibacteraceae bacterium]|nr:lactate utilization protein [Acutalibacteraceae bacterium]